MILNLNNKLNLKLIDFEVSHFINENTHIRFRIMALPCFICIKAVISKQSEKPYTIINNRNY